MIDFLKEATLGDILSIFGEQLVKTLYWWAEGAEKLVTFDILNFDIPQTLVTIFAIYLGFSIKGDAKVKWERFNNEVDNIAEALNSKEETENMIKYFRKPLSLYYDESYKDLSNDELLNVIKKRFKRKKPKIFLYVDQFFDVTYFYWIACLIYLFTYGMRT